MSQLIAHLAGADLCGADLSCADFSSATLPLAFFHGANLSGANFHQAIHAGAFLSSATLRGARLIKAVLQGANFGKSDLSGANLTGANLTAALLLETKLEDAVLTNCRVYGISAWNAKLGKGTKQQDLVITDEGEPEITVDNIEVAQFVYLLLHNEKIRDIIDTVGRKFVLLLGRFTEGRIAVLDRLRDELRKRGYVPLVFNFDKLDTKDFTETVRLLAGLSKFVIADISNPKSAPLELQATVPEIMVPFRPIIEEGEKPFSMLQDLRIKHREWVFETIYYSSVDALILLRHKRRRRQQGQRGSASASAAVDASTERGDGVWDVAFGPQGRIVWVGDGGKRQMFGSARRGDVLRGESSAYRRSEIGKRRCTA